MLYISIVLIIIIVCLYISSLRHADNLLADIDKKKHRLYFMYPMAKLLLTSTGLGKRLLNKTEISRKIRALYISDHHDYQIKLYWYQKISLLLLVLLSFSCISMVISIQAFQIRSQNVKETIIRPEEGEGDHQLSLRFRLENKNNKEDVYEDNINIKNKERVYTDKEWEEILEIAIPLLEKEMLGDNEDAKHIDKDLNFIKKIPATGIAVEWAPDDYRLLTSSGRLSYEKISDSGTDTLVTVILKYEDRRIEHTIPLTIWPIKQDNKTRLYMELQNVLRMTDQESSMATEWKLPNKVENYLITWQISEKNTEIFVFIIGLLGAVLLWIFMDKALDDRMKVRRDQLLLDYPEIINKFNLLVNAGMTIKQAWTKITEDYNKKIMTSERQRRYAYEEMLITLHELKLGVAEVNAYEQFGIRVGLLPFMKFSSILVQNLKKGNRNMTDLLKQEASEAFIERKEITKRLGEEASTKLLGPMMVLLLIVLIIILTPAFINFQM